MKNHMLGVLAVASATGVARAAPQRVGIGFVPAPPVYPIANATITPKPTPTDSGSTCDASCEIRYPELYGLSWAREDQIVFTETVTVATVSIVTMTMGNDSSVETFTVWDDESIARYHTLYHVSSDEMGTKIVEAGITLSDGYADTTFAYPTPFVDYPSQYHWQGIMSTRGKYDEPACATATEGFEAGEVTAHPLYPQPTDVVPDKSDPVGASYVPLWVPLQDLPDKKWFDNAFPSESAFASCMSVVGKPPPDIISTAKFVFTTARTRVSMVKPGFVHQESTATGFEETPTKGPPGQNVPGTARVESTRRGGFPTPFPSPKPMQSSLIGVPHIPSIVSTIPPWDTLPSARPSSPLVNNPSMNMNVLPTPTSSPGGGQPIPTRVNDNGAGQPVPTRVNDNGAGQPVPTPVNDDGAGQPVPIPVNNNGGGQPAPTDSDGMEQPLPVVNSADSADGQPAVTSAPAPTTPVFTFVPTTINGRPTATPVFILPGSSSIATIGQTVTFNGQTTVLAAPTAIFAIVPTTINGIATSAPAFIISGTSTATIGQTVTFDGQPTVLAAPAPFATEIPTTIFGIETHVTAFIISGSITAFPGQTVTLDGQVTALPTADAVFTTITTTVDGKESILPAYIISGSVTATIGQTVIIDGTATVLSTPTAGVQFSSLTTTIGGERTVVPVYVISGSITATLGQTVTIDGTATVLSSPTETDARAASVSTDSGGLPRATESTKGAARRSWSLSWDAVVAGVLSLWVLG